MEPVQLYKDASAWGKYVQFEHGTIVRICGCNQVEFTRELAEWMHLDDMDDVCDDSDEAALACIHAAEICYRDACKTDPTCADAFWTLYYGTFNPIAQCEIDKMIHVSGGDMDVWTCDNADTNPYACVELDRLFPHVVACFEIRDHNDATKI